MEGCCIARITFEIKRIAHTKLDRKNMSLQTLPSKDFLFNSQSHCYLQRNYFVLKFLQIY